MMPTDAAVGLSLPSRATRESATEGDHHITARGVTGNVMLVSAFLAAAALTQSVGSAVGCAHTGLLFLEPDTATLAVVDSAEGSIVDLRRQAVPSADAPTELATMVAQLESQPDGVFVVGCGLWWVAGAGEVWHSRTRVRLRCHRGAGGADVRGDTRREPGGRAAAGGHRGARRVAVAAGR